MRSLNNSFHSLQDCVQLNQYKLNKEIGKVIQQNSTLASFKRSAEFRKLFTFVLSTLQGSYGVVKLAYNEDSEQYYVSWA